MTTTEKELTPRIRGVYREAKERPKGHRYTQLSALQRHSYRSGPSPHELLAPLACPLAGLLCSKQRGWGHSGGVGACLLLPTPKLTEGPFIPGLPSWELPYADQGPREAPGCSVTQAHASPLPSQLRLPQGPPGSRRAWRGPAGAAEAREERPYLVVQSRRAGGGQGRARALLQGQPVPRVGGRDGGLPGARRVLGGGGRVLASWQVLLPGIHLKEERGKMARRGIGEARSRGGMVVPILSGTARSPSTQRL